MGIHFNSQPHEEADTISLETGISGLNISTHSLTKRLTEIFRGGRRGMNISTHSLTKRLTLFRLYSDLEAINFNSQPHEEADLLGNH